MNSEAFSSHKVFQVIDQLEEIINRDNFKKGNTLETSLYYQGFINHVRESIKFLNYNLILPSGLDAFSSEIEAGVNNLQLYLESNQLIYINNSISSINNALVKLSNFPFYLPNPGFDFSKSIAAFQDKLEQSYKFLKNLSDTTQTDLELNKKELINHQNSIQALVSQFGDVQKEFQGFLAKQTDEMTTFKLNISSVVESERSLQKELFEIDRKQFKDLFETYFNEHRAALENIGQSSNQKANEIILNLQEKEKEASKIVNIVGNIGVTGNYQNIANEHKKSADLFRAVALVFMVVMSGLLIFSILELSGEQFDPYKSLLRILAAAVLTYPAVYASRESTRHRNLETQNRNLELELAAIGPFIELLPEDQKQEIKADLVKKYFGRDSNVEKDKSESSDEVSVSALEKILKTILPYLKK